MDAELKDLPHDRESLAAMIRSLLLEAEQQKQRAEQQTRRAEELYLQVEPPAKFAITPVRNRWTCLRQGFPALSAQC